MIMKRLAIFDLDGTLLNTIEDLGQSANYALAKCGYPIHNMASYPFLVGNGVKNLLLRAMPEDTRSESAITQVMAVFKEYYNEHNCDRTVPYEGLPELLDTLVAMGVKVAVASNKYQGQKPHIGLSKSVYLFRKRYNIGRGHFKNKNYYSSQSTCNGRKNHSGQDQIQKISKSVFIHCNSFSIPFRMRRPAF